MASLSCSGGGTHDKCVESGKDHERGGRERETERDLHTQRLTGRVANSGIQKRRPEFPGKNVPDFVYRVAGSFACHAIRFVCRCFSWLRDASVGNPVTRQQDEFENESLVVTPPRTPPTPPPPLSSFSSPSFPPPSLPLPPSS